jgi:hypothetical protein
MQILMNIDKILLMKIVKILQLDSIFITQIF